MDRVNKWLLEYSDCVDSEQTNLFSAAQLI